MAEPDITIPREALVKAAKVLHDHAEIFVDVPWEDLSDGDQEAYIEEARATCIAMLRNWPGMHLGHQCIGCGGDPQIILPLTENTNERK